MAKSDVLKACMVITIVCVFCLSIGMTAEAQLLPPPVNLLTLTYSNLLTGTAPLLGFNTFNPFLTPIIAATYAAALPPIPTFPTINPLFLTTFPYATLNVLPPYPPPAYPTFIFGDPALYALWLGLQ